MKTDPKPTPLESQKERILHHLQQGYSITPREALRKFNCMRLGARILELKNEGHSISSRLVTVGDARVAEYEIEKKGKS